MKAISFLIAIFIFSWSHLPAARGTESFKAVQSYLDESVANATVAGGSVLVWHDGKIVFQTGFGFADVQSKTPFKINTPAIIASISKPLLGTTLYRMVDAGKLDVSIPITEYLPAFANRKLESTAGAAAAIKRAPTITELLTHTSGLRFDNAKGGRVWYQDWTRNQTIEFVVNKIARDFPFKAQPGTKYAYSGIGTEIAARVGEIVSQRPRNEMLVAHLCEPLGMTNTFYRDTAGLKKLGRPMPTRYYRSKTSGKLAISRNRPVAKPNRYSSSGGTIISTGPDLLIWLLMIRNQGVHDGRIFLKARTVEAMLQKHPLGKNVAGGLFIRVKDKNGKPQVLGHTGSSGTNVWIDLKTDTIGIMLTQTKGSDIKPFRIELERRAKAAILKSK